MKERNVYLKIRLHDIHDVNCFVRSLEYYEGDVTVKQGRYLVDGRSFLGICSLRLREAVDVEIITNNKQAECDFYQMLKKWSV